MVQSEQQRWQEFLTRAKNSLEMSEAEYTRFQELVKFIEENHLEYPAVCHTDNCELPEGGGTYLWWHIPRDYGISALAEITILKDGTVEWWTAYEPIYDYSAGSEIPGEEISDTLLSFLKRNFTSTSGTDIEVADRLSDLLIEIYDLNDSNISWDWVRFFNRMAGGVAHKNRLEHMILCSTANKCATMFRDSGKKIGGWV